MPSNDDPKDDPADYAWGKDPQAVVFPCSLCDQPAGTVKLTPDEGSLVIDGLVCRITHPIGPTDDVPRLRAVLANRDARALYALDGGWYDCTYGTCPEGHRHMVDD